MPKLNYVVVKAINDFDTIKSAIESMGVEVPYDTDTSEYGALIRSIPRSGGGSGVSARIGYVSLLAANWAGEGNLFSQTVNIDGVTANSQVDLTPDIQQLTVFYEKDLTFVTENDGGVVTVYAIGQKPTNDYTIQVTITEVAL